MKPENETCIAQLRVNFDLRVNKGRSRKHNLSKLSAWIRNRIRRKDNYTSTEIQEWSRLKREKRKRVFAALDCLDQQSPDWQVEVSAKRVTAMSLSAHPKTVYKTLRAEGYSEDEFEIEVEYYRKWGVL